MALAQKAVEVGCLWLNSECLPTVRGDFRGHHLLGRSLVGAFKACHSTGQAARPGVYPEQSTAQTSQLRGFE